MTQSFGEGADIAAQAAVASYLPYVRAELANGTHLAAMTRHMLGLFHGQPGARTWRRILTVEGARSGAGTDVIARGLEALAEASEVLEPVGGEAAPISPVLEAAAPDVVADAKPRARRKPPEPQAELTLDDAPAVD